MLQDYMHGFFVRPVQLLIGGSLAPLAQKVSTNCIGPGVRAATASHVYTDSDIAIGQRHRDQAQAEGLHKDGFVTIGAIEDHCELLKESPQPHWVNGPSGLIKACRNTRIASGKTGKF